MFERIFAYARHHSLGTPANCNSALSKTGETLCKILNSITFSYNYRNKLQVLHLRLVIGYMFSQRLHDQISKSTTKSAVKHKTKQQDSSKTAEIYLEIKKKKIAAPVWWGVVC